MLGIDAIIKHYESYVTDDNPPFINDNHVGAFLYYFSLKNKKLCTLFELFLLFSMKRLSVFNQNMY